MSLLITEDYITAISNLESFFKIYNDTKLKDVVVFEEKIDDIENLHNYEHVEENIKKYKLKVDELFNIINKISILIDKINSLPPHVVTLFLNGLREEQYEKVNYYQVEIEKIKKNIKHLENYLKLFEFYNLVSESLLKILSSNLNHDSIIPIHSCLINIRSGFLVNELQQPGAGGLLIIEIETYKDALEIVKNDPMIKNNLVEWKLNEWIDIN